MKNIAVFGIGGIGEGIVEKLLSEGHKLALFDVKEPRKDLINSNTKYYCVDCRKVEETRNKIDEALNDFGHFEALVYTSGVSINNPFLDVTEEQWDRVLDINLKGAFFVSQKFAQYFIDRNEGGSMCFISSVAAKTAASNTSFSYNISKAGLNNLVESLARRLGKHNITVNSVNPGNLWTPLWYEGLTPEMKKIRKAKYDEILAFQQIKGDIQPNDIGEAVSFLISDKAKYITAQHLYIDGGQF